MGSRRELFGCFLLTSEVSRAVLSPETASEFVHLSLFFSSSLLLHFCPFFSWFSTNGAGCFRCFFKAGFPQRYCDSPDFFFFFAPGRSAAFRSRYLHTGSVADNSYYDQCVLVRHSFGFHIPPHPLVHGLRQILVMSEQLLGLNRWWSFTGHNI